MRQRAPGRGTPDTLAAATEAVESRGLRKADGYPVLLSAHAGLRGSQRRGTTPVNSSTHSRLVALIWGIADDVLRDLYVRGKYRDVILPFTVL